MTVLDEKLEQYEKTFDDVFPTIPLLQNNSDEAVIAMIDRCIAANKDVYDIGILSLDNVEY